jgi:hypothetical protein
MATHRLLHADTRVPHQRTALAFDSVSLPHLLRDAGILDTPSTRYPYADTFFGGHQGASRIGRTETVMRVRQPLEYNEGTPSPIQVQIIRSLVSWRGGKVPSYISKKIKDDERVSEVWAAANPTERAIEILAEMGLQPKLMVINNLTWVHDLTAHVHGLANVDARIIMEDLTFMHVESDGRPLIAVPTSASYVRLSLSAPQQEQIDTAVLALLKIIGAKPEDAIGKPMVEIAVEALRVQ